MEGDGREGRLHTLSRDVYLRGQQSSQKWRREITQECTVGNETHICMRERDSDAPGLSGDAIESLMVLRRLPAELELDCLLVVRPSPSLMERNLRNEIAMVRTWPIALELPEKHGVMKVSCSELTEIFFLLWVKNSIRSARTVKSWKNFENFLG